MTSSVSFFLIARQTDATPLFVYATTSVQECRRWAETYFTNRTVASIDLHQAVPDGIDMLGRIDRSMLHRCSETDRLFSDGSPEGTTRQCSMLTLEMCLHCGTPVCPRHLRTHSCSDC
ncbi:MAG: hypothetical protein H0W02_10275 [Ktedonobacteraceae bacterium]|nr:hypothetical protein [Ktedonobacteraceae bacterium]